MNTVLLTGGTGTLGRAVAPRVVAEGHDLRILSRTASADSTRFLGDLATGAGLDRALRGVDTIIHCATNPRRGDRNLTQRLIDCAVRAEKPAHLIYISIVGVDQIPLGYYREKLATEQAIAASRLGYTVLRATQFHNLIWSIFRAQRRIPVVLAPSIRLQPIDVRDVATRLVAHVATGPAGQTPDIGGPEIFSAQRLALATLGSRRAILPLRLPGKTFSAFRAGYNLVPANRAGTRTFAQFLAER
ncbi:SDR family oxidoreductase [Cryobacterium suzukii]|uniref:SDR family oxidoreductase n=1 Tax=Cryobacterium suzukii TaxID=1259198 RepID=A0A4R9AFU6_9MICO|nr:SDR family oxidoreductase [Cryobacterium suzukii]TFD60271.1 SDR family oxidoreductase [Cryobacterium suzukii]